jgi:FAD:protein FMN transferase
VEVARRDEYGQGARLTHAAMGTVMVHRAFGPHADEGLEAARCEVARLEGRLSRLLPESDIARVNGSAGTRSERVSVEAWKVLAQAAAFARRYPGCYDVTDDRAPGYSVGGSPGCRGSA